MYSLPIPRSQIIMVNSIGSLRRAADNLLDSSVSVVGIDTESKPTFESILLPMTRLLMHAEGATWPVALMQVATKRSVFLFDLKLVNTMSEFSQLMYNLLANDTVTKLGTQTRS